MHIKYILDCIDLEQLECILILQLVTNNFPIPCQLSPSSAFVRRQRGATAVSQCMFAWWCLEVHHLSLTSSEHHHNTNNQSLSLSPSMDAPFTGGNGTGSYLAILCRVPTAPLKLQGVHCSAAPSSCSSTALPEPSSTTQDNGMLSGSLYSSTE